MIPCKQTGRLLLTEQVKLFEKKKFISLNDIFVVNA